MYADRSKMSGEWWTTLDLPNDTCGVEVYGSNCTSIMPATEQRNRNIVSIARIVIAFLSLIGTLTIIFSAIIKRRVLHPMIHPILMLSVADLLLAVLWMAGGILWFSQTGRGYSIIGCVAVSISTVTPMILDSYITLVMICVAVNLTLVYAIFAYIYIKHSAPSMTFQILPGNDESAVDIQYRIHPCKAITAYFIAWALPVVLELVSFGTAAIKTDVYTTAERCSCWCLPVHLNVQPFAYGTDVATAEFLTQTKEIWVASATVITVTYSVALPLLVVIYYKILKHIKKIRKTVSHAEIDAVIAKEESQARIMVVHFMFTFVLTGILNFIISLGGLIVVIGHVRQGTTVKMGVNPGTLTFVILLLHAILVPLQGFLNALVYGWTRKGFLQAIARPTKKKMAEMESGTVEPDRLGGNYQTFDRERSAFIVTIPELSTTARSGL